MEPEKRWSAIAAVVAFVLVAVVAAFLLTGNDESSSAVDTDSDTADVVPTESATGVAPTPTQAAATPDPLAEQLVAQREAALGAILQVYPGVQGEISVGVAVLNGSVTTELERADLDAEVRAAGLEVQNNVVSTGDGEPLGYSLNDLIGAQPELSTLQSLLAQADLGEALDGVDEGAQVTIFAPTNDAFTAIQDQLATLQEDPDKLRTVLLYHLLNGAQNEAAIAAATTLETQLDGKTIDVDDSGANLLLDGTAVVLVTDATGRNGVMHVISQVLLPTGVGVLSDEIGADLRLEPITFGAGNSELTDAGRAELDKVVAYLLENPGDIEIAGHTDSDGGTESNLALSQARADAVKDYLTGQGVPAESLTATGFGEEMPVAPNDSPGNKALNRRIEFRPS